MKLINKYYIYSFSSSFLGGLQMTLSSSLFLQKLNIFDENSMRMYNFFGKDIFGQVGGSFFALKYIKKFNKPNDKLIKKVCLFQSSVIFSESLIYFLPINLSIPMIFIVNIGKNIGWITLGALNQYNMKNLSNEEDNLPEIYSKLSIINTFGYSFGMMSGIYIYSYFEKNGVEYLIPLSTLLSILNYKINLKMYNLSK
jgi:hypothetical protein